jgi:hypothetical protein
MLARWWRRVHSPSSRGGSEGQTRVNCAVASDWEIWKRQQQSDVARPVRWWCGTLDYDDAETTPVFAATLGSVGGNLYKTGRCLFLHDAMECARSQEGVWSRRIGVWECNTNGTARIILSRAPQLRIQGTLKHLTKRAPNLYGPHRNPPSHPRLTTPALVSLVASVSFSAEPCTTFSRELVDKSTLPDRAHRPFEARLAEAHGIWGLHVVQQNLRLGACFRVCWQSMQMSESCLGDHCLRKPISWPSMKLSNNHETSIPSTLHIPDLRRFASSWLNCPAPGRTTPQTGLSFVRPGAAHTCTTITAAAPHLGLSCCS